MQALCSAAVVDKEGGRFTPQVKEEQPSELLADRQLGESCLLQRESISR